MGVYLKSLIGRYEVKAENAVDQKKYVNYVHVHLLVRPANGYN